MITADDNEALMISNQRKKEDLKAAKLKLAEKYQDVRRLAPLVEQGESVTVVCAHGCPDTSSDE